VVTLLAVMLVKPVGVSTQFVILDAMVWDMVAPDTIVENTDNAKGYGSENAYLNKSGGKYAANAKNPLNYSFVFVIAMIVGAGLSSFFGGDKAKGRGKEMPDVWRKRFGDSKGKRYFAAFASGFLVLFGARLAGGCTSGHMMSGIMQTSLSGYLFLIAAFAVGTPVAILVYRGVGKGEIS
jgi:hypothetical protein